ncbi:MAG: hypothetical protein IPL86_10730 [Flavobacteriales bacterium]|nr:hypothetical protein [Flavobacteriales bacterium]
MKASALIVAVAFILSPILSNATIWRVNNNPVLASNCDHCFTDLAEAVANPFVSANGARDTIHLEASPMNYGSVTMAKPIVLIGPGFKLGMGTANNPDLQANNQMATATDHVGGRGQTVVSLLEFDLMARMQACTSTMWRTLRPSAIFSTATA